MSNSWRVRQGQKHCPMSENNISQKKRQLCLVRHSFSKLLQNMRILMYQYARFSAKLWKTLWFYCVFSVFSYIIVGEYSCLKYFILTKLSQIVYVIDVHILAWQNAKYDCRLWKVFLFNCDFLWIFKHNYIFWNVIASSNFYKLYVKTEV